MKLSRVDLEKLAEQQNDHITELQAELSRARTHNGELLIALANSVSFEAVCKICKHTGIHVKGVYACWHPDNPQRRKTKKDCPLLNLKKKGA
jgi:hypothetical protein